MEVPGEVVSAALGSNDSFDSGVPGAKIGLGADGNDVDHVAQLEQALIQASEAGERAGISPPLSGGALEVALRAVAINEEAHV
ncbi:MAG: hypothetical protein ACLFO1_10490 [Spirochaetaceae bacterium]